MKRILAFMLGGILILSVYNSADAAVLTFDDITTDSPVAIPSNYGGFIWGTAGSADEVRAVQDTIYGNTYNYPFSTPDINYAAFNYTGNTKTIYFNDLIEFNGAYFSGFGFENEVGTWDDFPKFPDNTTPWTATQVTVTGYCGNTLIGSISLDLNPSYYQWLAADFAVLVDSLVIESAIFFNDQRLDVASSFWLMDNFTFNEDIDLDSRNAAPVPEPATMLLLGTGMIGLAGMRRISIKS